MTTAQQSPNVIVFFIPEEMCQIIFYYVWVKEAGMDLNIVGSILTASFEVSQLEW